MTFNPQPKPRPAALERADRRKARESVDAAESRKVKARSGGRCEVRLLAMVPTVPSRMARRCSRSSAPGVHHMIGGFGVRGRGQSALAEHKQDVCFEHHRLITIHVLQRQGGPVPQWTDPYVRVR